MQNKIIEARFSALNIPKDLKIYISGVNGFSSMSDQSVQSERSGLIDYVKYLSNERAVFFIFQPPINDDLKKFQPIIDFNEWATKYIESFLNLNYIIFNIPMVIGYVGIDDGDIHTPFLSEQSDKDFIFNNTYFQVIEINDLYDLVNSNINSNLKKLNINSQNTLSIEKMKAACYAKNTLDFPECMILKRDENNEFDRNKSIIWTKPDPNFLRNVYRASDITSCSKKLLSIVVPTYNEEKGIEEFYRRLKLVLNQLHLRFDHEIIFVNDFSKDLTLEKLLHLRTLDSSIHIINFARNFGNQSAIAAGLDFLRGDLAVIIDDDLQDPLR